VNLLSNAAKYGKSDQAIQIKVSRQDDEAIVEVIDHGQGISEQDMKNLFAKFGDHSDVASNHIKSSGLGLYLVMKLVELHRGKVSVRSEPNVETVFSVVLPVK
jgi:signal transduction histidine kinase